MAVQGATIEIKKDLSRFEDSYYDFIDIDFKGLPITVTSFVGYKIPTRDHLIFMTINPVVDLDQNKKKKQYCIVIDTDALVAQEVELESEKDSVFSKIFFVDHYRLLG